MRIVIAGAGSIGCFVGGLLAARHDVTLLGRARVLDAIRANGLQFSDFAGLDRHVAPGDLRLSQDPACLAVTDLIIVAVKSADTAGMAAQIATHAPRSAPVLSFQNGLAAIDALRAGLPGHDCRAAMVPFNVVPLGPGALHRASSGDIVIGAGPGALEGPLSVPDLPVIARADITAVQWGKLVINLTNALNALSGLTLREMLLQPAWRRLMAAQMAEALGVLRAAGIPVASTLPVPMGLVPYVLRLPTPVFARVAAQMLTLDPQARSSMAYDVQAGRGTEIDQLQGEILQLAARSGRSAPIVTRVAQAVHDVTARGETAPHLPPDVLWPQAVR